MSNVHFSSKTDDWATPQAFFEKLVERFDGFDLDAAASIANSKCGVDYLDDALNCNWRDVVNTTLAARYHLNHQPRIFLNPPYGRIIGKFMAKAVEAYKDGCLVVCLVPARTDTAWWHDHVLPYAKVEFIRGRLKFGNAKNSAPFPSALVIYDGRTPAKDKEKGK